MSRIQESSTDRNEPARQELREDAILGIVGNRIAFSPALIAIPGELLRLGRRMRRTLDDTYTEIQLM
jgi:hypothetical protein